MSASPARMALAVQQASTWLRTLPGALKIAGINQAEQERVIGDLADAETALLWLVPNVAFLRACVKNRDRIEAMLGRMR